MLKHPVIYSRRSDLSERLSHELEALGFEQVGKAESREDCLEALGADASGLLVLDWELGVDEVNTLLGQVKGRYHAETRPVFLVGTEMCGEIVATGCEYGVAKIEVGAVDDLPLKESLEGLAEEERQNEILRETLVKVAEARAEGRVSEVTSLLQSLYQENQDNERAATEYAENLILEDAWTKALTVLEPFTHKYPPSIRALHLKGRCLLKMGKLQPATACLEKAKALNPHNVDRLIDLGQAFLRSARFEEALKNFEEAMRIDPSRSEAVEGKGTCLLVVDEVNEAMSLLRSVSGSREVASIFNSAAVIAAKNQQPQKAIPLYAQAIKAVGEQEDKIAARVFFNMGLGYERWKKMRKARLCFEKALELDEGLTKASRRMADLLEMAEATESPEAEEAEDVGSMESDLTAAVSEETGFDDEDMAS